jgi:hypothetical protein
VQPSNVIETVEIWSLGEWIAYLSPGSGLVHLVVRDERAAGEDKRKLKG